MFSDGLLRLRAGDLAPGRPYAERDEREAPMHDRVALALWHGLLRPALRPLRGEGRRSRAFVALVESHAGAVAALASFATLPQELRLHSAPERPIHIPFPLPTRSELASVLIGWLSFRVTIIRWP